MITHDPANGFCPCGMVVPLFWHRIGFSRTTGHLVPFYCGMPSIETYTLSLIASIILPLISASQVTAVALHPWRPEPQRASGQGKCRGLPQYIDLRRTSLSSLGGT